MTKRQRLEKIIIGTLLDISNHYEDVRGYITEDMFSDSTCRCIYGMIVQMRNEGFSLTDPNSIFQRYGEQVTDILPTMCELCTNYSFEYMKIRFNEEAFLCNHLLGTNYPTTNVEFSVYVKEFINLVLEYEKKREFESAADFAA